VLTLAPTLTLTKLSVGPMDNNAYLLRTLTPRCWSTPAAEPSGCWR
jgi:hypothetical protein